MSDHKEMLINNILFQTLSILPEKEQSDLSDILVRELYKYNVTLKESNELATCDDASREILKMFLVTKSIQGVSKNTMRLYTFQINAFIDTLNKSIVDVQTDDVRYFLAYYKNIRKVSNTTLNNIRLTFSSFFGWLMAEGYIKENPMTRIQPIKKDTHKEEPFSKSDEEKLKIACGDNMRNRALVEFLLSSGCRVNEVSNVKLSDINFREATVEVIGKGNKKRIVYISEKAMVHIVKYLDTRKGDSEYLFCSTKSPYNKLSKGAIEGIIKELGKKSGVENAHPHRFRRTLCCRLIDSGMDIVMVKKILGHEKLDTTMIYYNDCEERVKSEYKRAIA